MADILLELKPEEEYIVTKPTSIGRYVSDDEILGTYLTENDFAFTFEKIDNKIFLKRIGRNDVELEREADNIFHQKFDPAFKQEFKKNSKGEMEITAYYTNHSPYSLVKVNLEENCCDLKAINGVYKNAETKTTLKVNYLNGNAYEITFGADYKTRGLLVSTNKILVDFYTLEIQNEDLLLNGERIKKVKYSRK
jgi:hypothetical protein